MWYERDTPKEMTIKPQEGDVQKRLQKAKEQGIEPSVSLDGYEFNGKELALHMVVREGDTHLSTAHSHVSTNVEGLSLQNAVLLGFKEAFPENVKLQAVSHVFELTRPEEAFTALQFTAVKEVVGDDGQVGKVPFTFTSFGYGEKRDERVVKGVTQAVQLLTL